jgi:hypothetical protein
MKSKNYYIKCKIAQLLRDTSCAPSSKLGCALLPVTEMRVISNLSLFDRVMCGAPFNYGDGSQKSRLRNLSTTEVAKQSCRISSFESFNSSLVVGKMAAVTSRMHYSYHLYADIC